jgi:probable HAF family extracellular repeat protein
MKRQSFCLFVISFAVGAASHARGQQPNLTTLDFPAATSTQGWGINIYRDIVGVYTAADSTGHGFIWTAGRFASIDYPGAALTGSYGINDRGDVVGLYATTPTGSHHGFLMTRDGKFTALDFPGAASTEGAGINNRGEITGLYTLADGSTHGFLLNAGGFTNIDYPGAPLSFGNGIGSSGAVVGNYRNSQTHGYLLTGKDFSSVDVPGATFTGAYGVSPDGTIIGRFTDAQNVTHGYLLSGGRFTTIDVPGATFTGGAAINSNGDIAGRYVSKFVSHAFLLAKPPAKYTITDLGVLPGGKFSQATLVNDNGLIAGLANQPGGDQHSILWQGAHMLDIGKSGLGGPNNAAFGVNSRGTVLVQAESAATDPNQENFCAYGTGLKCLPALWRGGVMTQLPLLGGNNGTVGVINQRGEAAGIAETAIRDPECPTGVSVAGTGPQVLDFQAVIWGPRAGEVHALPPLPGDTVSMALSINENGQAVGASGHCSNTVLPPFAFGPHAVLWERDGSVIDLGTLGGPIDAKAGIGHMALSLNNLAQVVGGSALPDSSVHGFLWSPDSGMRDLGTLPGDAGSVGSAINDLGQIVGASVDNDGNPRGYLWQNGVMMDFNTLVGESPMFILFTSGINNHGEIVGFGATDAGDVHAFVATPTGETGGGEFSPMVLSPEVRGLIRSRLPINRIRAHRPSHD